MSQKLYKYAQNMSESEKKQALREASQFIEKIAPFFEEYGESVEGLIENVSNLVNSGVLEALPEIAQKFNEIKSSFGGSINKMAEDFESKKREMLDELNRSIESLKGIVSPAITAIDRIGDANAVADAAQKVLEYVPSPVTALISAVSPSELQDGTLRSGRIKSEKVNVMPVFTTQEGQNVNVQALSFLERTMYFYLSKTYNEVQSDTGSSPHLSPGKTSSFISKTLGATYLDGSANLDFPRKETVSYKPHTSFMSESDKANYKQNVVLESDFSSPGELCLWVRFSGEEGSSFRFRYNHSLDVFVSDIDNRIVFDELFSLGEDGKFYSKNSILKEVLLNDNIPNSQKYDALLEIHRQTYAISSEGSLDAFKKYASAPNPNTELDEDLIFLVMSFQVLKQISEHEIGNDKLEDPAYESGGNRKTFTTEAFKSIEDLLNIGDSGGSISFVTGQLAVSLRNFSQVIQNKGDMLLVIRNVKEIMTGSSLENMSDDEASFSLNASNIVVALEAASLLASLYFIYQLVRPLMSLLPFTEDKGFEDVGMNVILALGSFLVSSGSAGRISEFLKDSGPIRGMLSRFFGEGSSKSTGRLIAGLAAALTLFPAYSAYEMMDDNYGFLEAFDLALDNDLIFGFTYRSAITGLGAGGVTLMIAEFRNVLEEKVVSVVSSVAASISQNLFNAAASRVGRNTSIRFISKKTRVPEKIILNVYNKLDENADELKQLAQNLSKRMKPVMEVVLSSYDKLPSKRSLNIIVSDAESSMRNVGTFNPKEIFESRIQYRYIGKESSVSIFTNSNGAIFKYSRYDKKLLALGKFLENYPEESIILYKALQ